MRRKYTEKEIKEKLSEMTVIVDSRENQNKHFIDYFEKKKIPYIIRKLDCGDYSAQINEGGQTFTLENEIVIEKKNSLDEIAGNFTVDRERFEREFLRAKAKGTKIFLLVENASYELIYAHAYRSKLLPKSFIASLLSWQARYGITVVFCEKTESPELIYGILYYAVKEALEN